MNGKGLQKNFVARNPGFTGFQQILLFLVVSSLFFFLCVAGFFAVFEDAFISFRYAQNLGDGHGLVFNVGERVWGYSNFLWTVCLALCIKFGLPVILSAKCLGVLCAMAIIGLLFRWSEGRDSKNLVLMLSGPLLLATSTHFILAAQNGMETLLFTGLAFGGILSLIYSIERHKTFPLYAILFLLASLTRPEGPLLMVVAVGIEAIVFLRSRDRMILKRVSLAAAIFIIAYGTYILVMYSYYGYPLPNAFYIKVAPFSTKVLLRGLKYVTSFFSDIHYYILLFPILFGTFDRVRQTRNWILATFALSYLMFVIYVGGDFQVYFCRFLIPLLPVLFLMVANGLSAMYALLQTYWPGKARLIFSLIFALILITNFVAVRSPVIPFFSPTADRKPIILDNLSLLAKNPGSFGAMTMSWFSDESLDIHPMGMVGQALARQIPRSKTVATGQCGQIPFYLEGRRVMDVRGLMDNHVAQTGGISIDYIKTSNIEDFILYYNETLHYYVPRTLIPGIIFSPYFQSNYVLKHVFCHKAFLWPGKLESTAYMLLFSKRKNPAVDTGAVYNLKDQINDRIASGHVTELVCHINGPERGQHVIPARSVGRDHDSPPTRPADTDNS
jgi:hypothetical protein